MGKPEENGWQETPFGPVPGEWAIKPLSECAVVQTGVAKGRKLKPAEAVSVPYLRVANVQDGYLDLSEMKKIEIRRSELNRYSLEPGDVVLTEGGDFDKLGRGFIWNGEVSGCVHQNHIFAVRPRKDALLPEFLAYLTQSPYGKAYFLSVAHKTTNLACINTTKLKAFPALLPPLHEQRAIALVLRAVQQAKQATDRVVAAARQLKQSFMRHLFTYGPVPVEKAEQVPLKVTEIGQVPQHWDLKKCGDLCEQISVGIVVKPASHYIPTGVPAFRSFNVREDRLVPNDLVFISEEVNNTKFAKSKLRTGDVLIVRTGYPGTSCVVPPEYDGANCIDLVFARTKSKDVRSSYFSRFFNSSAGKEQAISSKTGLAQQHLNVGSVKTTLVPVPTLAEQDAICLALATIDKKVDAEQSRRQALESLFNSLLHHLMTGKVRVNHLKLPT